MDTANRLLQMEGRLKKGIEYSAIALARLVLEDVQRIAPEVAGLQYAKDMYVAYFGSHRDEQWTAIVHDGYRSEVQGDELDTSLVRFKSNDSVDPVGVALEMHSPWPAYLVPVKPGQGVEVYKAEASSEAIKTRSQQILRDRRKIERDFEAAGVDVTLSRTQIMKGVLASEELGMTVLRVEFGIDMPQRSHWRPALTQVERHIQAIGEVFLDYLMTGNKTGFGDLQVADMNYSAITNYSFFQRKIAEAVL